MISNFAVFQVAIMQENGEVVCCLGSSANLANVSVFLQADASIGIGKAEKLWFSVFRFSIIEINFLPQFSV